MMKAIHGVSSWMSETAVPKVGGVVGRESFNARSLTHGVERTGTIASKNHGPGWKGLHRETKRIKFDRAIIVSGELANGNKILDNVRNNKYVSKIKRNSRRLEGFRTNVSSGKGGAVTDGD